MVNKLFIFIVAVFALGVVTSCSDETLCNEIITSETAKTRAIVQEVSPTFDWEDNNYIKLEGIGNNVILPW